MLSIQTVGSEILGNTPKSFYVFGGEEYGIKHKYLRHLANYYKGSVESPAVDDVLTLMRGKRLLPLPPKLYIVRYDESFLATLSADTQATIEKTKISGTIVCIYENQKQVSKCDKYLPEHTTVFNKVNPNFLGKYLKDDYPSLSDEVISAVLKVYDDYMSAYLLCNSLALLSPEYIESRGIDAAISALMVDNRSGRNFRYAFAARNVRGCLDILDEIDDYNSIYIAMLSAILELESLLCKSKYKSDLSSYVKYWDADRICSMFSLVSDELERSRTYSGYDMYNSIVYIISRL